MGTKPTLSYENGILKVDAQFSQAVDGDADGKKSVTASATLAVEVDAYEAVTEIAKKDLPLVEMILKTIKVK